jgi:predicted RNase H-like HicB family nuclease
MLPVYINAAMRTAHNDYMEGDEGHIDKIPKLQGVWANADSLESCRDELREVLEEWIMLGLKNLGLNYFQQ